ncbi:carbamoyl-phosphate synthase large chain [Sporolactobacillus inulinus]|uniref:Carbamoyl-phosphate synthase large chain n=1 Tax=Sporolactobacillus inulinus TaxID=2078 RepID=A0A4Y1ZDH6_9BACL|nr:carbamoyl-phosphate synthase large chain [Sporolactobacillus inulinus]
MAIDRTFEGALNKGIRSLEMGFSGLENKAFTVLSDAALENKIKQATDLRLFAISELFRRGRTVDDLWNMTAIDPWFLNAIHGIVAFEEAMKGKALAELSDEVWQQAKWLNIGNQRLADLLNVPPEEISKRVRAAGLSPSYHWWIHVPANSKRKPHIITRHGLALMKRRSAISRRY